jgi:hypothetical protein
MERQMRFELRQPCDQCPFRQDTLRGWLGEERAREIAQSVVEWDRTFPCHKTVTHDDDDPQDTEAEQHCAGALQFVLSYGWPNWRLRLAQRMGLWDPTRLRTHIPVFASIRAMAQHHARPKRKGGVDG